MPLLIDLSQSTGAASAVGGHAHCAVCAVLPRVSSYDAIPPLLSALDRSTASSVARARSTEQLIDLCGIGTAFSCFFVLLFFIFPLDGD